MSSRIKNEKVATADDDELDAWIAWYLARCWFNNSGAMLVGNARHGSFLLPLDEVLRDEFEKFINTD